MPACTSVPDKLQAPSLRITSGKLTSQVFIVAEKMQVLLSCSFTSRYELALRHIVRTIIGNAGHSHSARIQLFFDCCQPIYCYDGQNKRRSLEGEIWNFIYILIFLLNFLLSVDKVWKLKKELWQSQEIVEPATGNWRLSWHGEEDKAVYKWSEGSYSSSWWGFFVLILTISIPLVIE